MRAILRTALLACIVSALPHRAAARDDDEKNQALLRDAAAPKDELALAREVLRRAVEVEGGAATIQFLQAVAVAQARAGDFESALRNVERIEAIQYDVGLRLLATALADEGDFKRAEEVAGKITDKTDGYAKQLPLAWLAIAEAKARRRDRAAPEAFRKAADAVTPGEQGWSAAQRLSEIALAQARSGDRAGARECFRRALDCLRQEQRAVFVEIGLRELAVAQARAGEVKQAMETLNRDEIQSGRARCLADVAAAQAEAGDLAGAKEAARQVEDSCYHSSALRAIAAAQLKRGDRDAARATLKRAAACADKWTGPESRIADLCLTALAFAEAGDAKAAEATLERALRILETSTETRYKGGGLHDIASAQAKVGLPAAAKETFAKALKEGALAQGIAKAQAKVGFYEDALETAKGLKNRYDWELAVEDIAGARARGGDVAGALKMLDSLTNETLQESLRAAVAEAQLAAGDWRGAQKTAETIGDGSWWKADLVRKIGWRRAEEKDVKGALTWAVAQKSRQVQSSALLGTAEGVLNRRAAQNSASRP